MRFKKLIKYHTMFICIMNVVKIAFVYYHDCDEKLRDPAWTGFFRIYEVIEISRSWICSIFFSYAIKKAQF